MSIKTKSAEFAKCIQLEMRNLRGEKRFCDFNIVVGDTTILVHKLVMAASSNFCKLMLQHDSLESRQNQVVIKENFSVDTMTAILDFCYSSEINLQPDNVHEIITAAAFLQIGELLNTCGEYAASILSVSNCLKTLIIADACNQIELKETALIFCLDKFSTITDSEEFLELEQNLLVTLIKDNRMNACEDEVYAAVVKWFNRSDERMSALPNVMEHVRFAQMTPPFLTSLRENFLMRTSSKCRDLIEDAKDFLLCPTSVQNHLPRFHPRNGRAPSPSLEISTIPCENCGYSY